MAEPFKDGPWYGLALWRALGGREAGPGVAYAQAAALVRAHADAPTVSVKHEGQTRECPAPIAAELRRLGADVEVVR